ncbi:response regulator transcription factor [Paenibacillus sp.]|uniref:response regulator transcription factor n=1 Tax=Paenibacillus sp. TaxID=58172 RepID=UPI002D483C2A|nr:response regulator [Paenibacillus sp.]HZG83384.1 response regulator [Paenibacillus sp.]
MKLLIADDSVSIHTFITKSFDWGKLGIEAIEHAYDGEETIRRVREGHPDLLILDIEMPYRTGIEVLETTHGQTVAPHTVILSAYDKFQYAREAMKYGAKQYLLKPIDPNQLVEALQSMVDLVKQKARTNLKQKIPALLPERTFLVEQVEDEIKKSLRILRFRHHATALIGGVTGLAKRLQDCPAYRELRDRLLVFPVDDSQCFIVFDAEMRSKEVLLRLGTRLREELAPEAGEQERLTIGWSAFDAPGVGESLQQSNDAYLRGYYEGSGVFFHDPLYFAREDDPDFALRWKRRLFDALEQRYSEAVVKNMIDEMFASLLSHKAKPSRVRAWCEEWLYEMASVACAGRGHGPRTAWNDPGTSLKETKRRFKESLLSLFPGRTPSSSEMIQLIKKYIDNNPGDVLNLEALSEKFHMNKFVISRMFKSEIGENFWGYVTKVRIERAQALLENTDMKMVQIATSLGFQEESHFSNVFKKYTGCSPKEYRIARKNDSQ